MLHLAGIRDWYKLVELHARGNLPSLKGFSGELLERLVGRITLDIDLLESENLPALAERLSRREHWRLYPWFYERAVFLDIETTGSDPESTQVTVISTFSAGDGPEVFIDGFNMHHFHKKAQSIEFVVTFNGSTFDIPILQRTFPKLSPCAHVDLRWLCQRLGMKGALKSVEKALGIERHPEVRGLTGSDAVVLWRRWILFSDRAALERLVRYNLEDTMNLPVLLHELLERLYTRAGFDFRNLGEKLRQVERQAWWIDVGMLLGELGV
ncbi:MAG: hypothetical protein D6806_01760 [Deltaproteobacteria bacterium]|nr:MAG: hypothetical protein D6806_01760 [Deltaproteobacteria bacterium]